MTGIQNKLKTFVLPFHYDSTVEDYCPVNTTCEELVRNQIVSQKRFCACKNGLVGRGCNEKPNLHVVPLDLTHLPTDMRTPEGFGIIDSLHVTMNKLEDRMILKLGQDCNQGHHQDLERGVNFFKDLRRDCNCEWSGSEWNCGEYGRSKCDTNTAYKKSAFDVILNFIKALESKSSTLCNINGGLACVSGKCGCPNDGKTYFYENGRCYLELGEICGSYSSYLVPQPWLHTCRRGQIHCQWGGASMRCESSSPAVLRYVSGVSSPDPSSPTYVSEVKDEMVRFLRERETEFKVKLAASDKLCERGTKVVAAIEDISALLRPGRLAGGRQDDLMEIRLMTPVIDTAASVAQEIRISGRICETATPGSPGKAGNTGKTKEDMDEHDADGEDRYPEFSAGRAQAQLKANKFVIGIVGIITILLTFGI